MTAEVMVWFLAFLIIAVGGITLVVGIGAMTDFIRAVREYRKIGRDGVPVRRFYDEGVADRKRVSAIDLKKLANPQPFLEPTPPETTEQRVAREEVEADRLLEQVDPDLARQLRGGI